jgi:hypothetical protein
MADVGDGLGYAQTIEFHRSKKLDRVAEYFKKLDKIKELATEKFIDMKDYCKNNKRYITYVAITAGSGIANYTLTGNLLGTAGITMITGSVCGLDEVRHIKKE